MSIDVTVSGLNTVVDVSMSQTGLIDADSGQVIVIEDYNNLQHKPSINSVTLSGNKTSSDIGVADAVHTHTTSDVTDFPTDVSSFTNDSGYITSASLPTDFVGTDGVDAGAAGLVPAPTTSDVNKFLKSNGTWATVSGGGGGASAFTAEFGTTIYADVKDAYDNDAILICTVPDSGNTMVLQLVYFDAANEIFFFAFPTSDGWYLTQLSNADGWGDGQFYFASTDVATQLADGLMSALDKQKLDGLSKRNIWYGTCSTSASSSPKSITTASGDFSLIAGNMLVVLFSHTNSLSSVSLQVDGGTSKSAYAMDGTSDISNRWGSGEVVSFVYDGTKFIMLEQGKASTTAYGITKLNNTVTSTSTSEAATANAVKSAYDNGGVQSVNGSTGAVTLTIPTDTSDLTNGAGYITGYTETDPVFVASDAYGITSSDISNWNGKSDFSGDYGDLTNKPTIPSTAADVGAVPTTRTVNGKALSSDITLSASDVSALPSSTVIPTITDTYSGTSSNGMSGKAVKSAIDALDGSVSGSAGSGKTLTAFSQTNGVVSATFGNISITKSQVSDFPTLATVATSGSYTDLTDKPTIPTVNNATLTIQKNGTDVQTFTANASSNVTCNITVPTSAADVSAVPTSAVGANSGVCPLDSSGKIDASYLPVYNGGVS